MSDGNVTDAFLPVFKKVFLKEEKNCVIVTERYKGRKR